MTVVPAQAGTRGNVNAPPGWAFFITGGAVDSLSSPERRGWRNDCRSGVGRNLGKCCCAARLGIFYHRWRRIPAFAGKTEVAPAYSL